MVPEGLLEQGMVPEGLLEQAAAVFPETMMPNSSIAAVWKPGQCTLSP